MVPSHTSRFDCQSAIYRPKLGEIHCEVFLEIS